MRIILAIIAVIVSGLCNAELRTLPKDLATEAGTLAATLSDGHAVFYPEYSKYIETPGIETLGYTSGVAVLMSLGGWGGGNTNNQYVALYAINEKLPGSDPYKKYRLVSFAHVGGKGDQIVADLRATDQGLILVGFGYGEGDSLCCPTRPWEITVDIGEWGTLMPRSP